jgi:endonuclease III
LHEATRKQTGDSLSSSTNPKMIITYVVINPNTSDIRSKQMTKKVIKDLTKNTTTNNELKQEDLDKISGGLVSIGGFTTKAVTINATLTDA